MATNNDLTNAIFLVALNRNPDTAGAAYALSELAGGMDAITFDGTYIDSTEFHTGPYYPHSIVSTSTLASVGNTDFTAYVTELYTLALGYVTPAGVTFWVNSGNNAANLMHTFIQTGLSAGRLSASITQIIVSVPPIIPSLIGQVSTAYASFFPSMVPVYISTSPDGRTQVSYNSAATDHVTAQVHANDILSHANAINSFCDTQFGVSSDTNDAAYVLVCDLAETAALGAHDVGTWGTLSAQQLDIAYVLPYFMTGAFSSALLYAAEFSEIYMGTTRGADALGQAASEYMMIALGPTSFGLTYPQFNAYANKVAWWRLGGPGGGGEADFTSSPVGPDIVPTTNWIGCNLAVISYMIHKKGATFAQIVQAMCASDAQAGINLLPLMSRVYEIVVGQKFNFSTFQADFGALTFPTTITDDPFAA